jgi:hypothetical protein
MFAGECRVCVRSACEPQHLKNGMLMKIRLTLLLIVLSACPTLATLRIDMYLSDGNTPLALRDPNTPNVYRDIMVGAKLTVIVSSDKKAKTTAMIGVPWDDVSVGELTARGYDVVTNTWEASRLKDSGTSSTVWYQPMTAMKAFLFDSGGLQICPGKWFIFDYLAKTVGSCDIILGTAPVVVTGGGEPPLTTGETMAIVMKIMLNQVPSRDFNGDTIVNLRDFALFANHWQTQAEADPNSASAKSDLDSDGYVGASDLRQLCRFWLDRTDIMAPGPNAEWP